MAVFAPVPARVARPDLASRIAAQLERGGLLVVAGAGYGKTTAVEDGLAAWGRAAAWLPITEREREPGQLLVGILQALEDAVPGAGGPLLDAVAAGAAADPADLPRRLLAELDALLVEPVALVVDDAERLAGATGSLAILGTLLQARGSRLRVVVASRRPLELGVAKARAAGQVGELGEAELVFSAEECATLLREALEREPSPAEVAARMEVTLGWPLGVALGAPAGDDHEHTLRAFLVEEVLDRLEAPLRDAVLDASAVDELSPGVMDALGLAPGFRAAAPALGLPLRPVPGRPDAVTFHPLVRELLRERWRETRRAEERRALLARVVAPLTREGRVVEAVAAAMDAEEWEAGLRTIAVDAAGHIAAAPETLRAWLARLPAESRRGPLARMLAGRLLMAEGRPGDAADELQQALEGLGDRDAGVAWSTRLVLAECLYFSGRVEEVPALAEGIGVPGVRELGAAQAVALWAAMAHAALGRPAEAEALAEAVRRAGGEDVGVLRTWREAYLHGPGGDVDEVLSRIARELDAAGRDPHLWRPDLLLPTSMFLLVSQGRIDEALAVSDHHQRLMGDATVRPDVRALGHELRAWLLALAGRVPEAEVELEAARVALPDAWSAAWFTATAAMIARAHGEPGALRLALQGLEAMQHAPVLLADIGAFSLVPVVAERDPAAAQAAVGVLLERLAVTHPGAQGRFHRARLLAQRAGARHAAGDTAGAAADVASALGEGSSTSEHVLRAEWPRLRAAAIAALAGGLDPDRLLGGLEVALPGELLAFTEHEAPAVRARAAEGLGRSGHGEALGRLAALAADPDPAVVAAAAAATEHARRLPPVRSFTLLGGFGLRRGEWPVPEREWERPMAQRLVRLLLVRRGEAVFEDELLEAFWPDKAVRPARASLQVAVSRARAVLDPPGADTSAIRSSGGTYRLVLDARDRVDAERFLTAADAALDAEGASRGPLVARALALWTGEPLPDDRYADWARPARERLEHRHLALLRAQLDEHLARGDNGQAVEAAQRALEVDPLHEGVHRALMVAFARAGRRGRALRQYLECRRALVDALGIEPDEETTLLQRRILAGALV